jgi:hypothetical protein
MIGSRTRIQIRDFSYRPLRYDFVMVMLPAPGVGDPSPTSLHKRRLFQTLPIRPRRGLQRLREVQNLVECCLAPWNRMVDPRRELLRRWHEDRFHKIGQQMLKVGPENSVGPWDQPGPENVNREWHDFLRTPVCGENCNHE